MTANIQAAARQVLDGDSASKQPGDDGPNVVIGQGNDWEAALNDVDWQDGDLLVIGSSESGPVARVFLGSRAAKIVRHAPMPVLVVPRGTASSCPRVTTKRGLSALPGDHGRAAPDSQQPVTAVEQCSHQKAHEIRDVGAVPRRARSVRVSTSCS